MENIQSSGSYTVKETGDLINYEFSFPTFTDVDDCVDELGADKVLALINRMVKVDAGNTAREKAKTANGHSAHVPMSEADKAEKKAERQADKALLTALKNNPDLLAQLGL